MASKGPKIAFKCTGCNGKSEYTQTQIDNGAKRCIECNMHGRDYELIPSVIRTFPKSNIQQGSYDGD